MRRTVLFLYMTFIVAIAHAQIPLGFKAGINTNKIVVRDAAGQFDDDSDIGVSFHLGVYTKLKLSDKFNFIPELQFIQKQSKSSSGNIRLNYIELPLLISYQPIQWLNIEAGPSLGLNIGSNLYADVYESVDGGINGGLRFNLTPKWSILGRYYYGVTPIEKIYFTMGPVGTPPPAVIKFYNETLQFSVAYYLK
jgi:hypothetical protein